MARPRFLKIVIEYRRTQRIVRAEFSMIVLPTIVRRVSILFELVIQLTYHMLLTVGRRGLVSVHLAWGSVGSMLLFGRKE